MDYQKEGQFQWKASQWFLNQLVEKQIPTASFFQLCVLHQRYQNFVKQLAVSPEKSVDLQLIYWQELFFIWQGFMQKQSHHPTDCAALLPIVAVIKEVYLLHMRHFHGLLTLAVGLDKKIKKQVDFYLKQITAGFSSTAVAMNKPEAWSVLERQTEGLLKGLNRVIDDLKNASGIPITF